MTQGPGAPAPRKQTMPSTQMSLGGKALTLKFGYLASACLEDLYDLPIAQVGQRLSDPEVGVRLKDLERVMFAGLREHHADLTLEDVRKLLADEVESGRPFGDIMEDTFKVFGGAAEDAPPARPRKPAQKPAKSKRSR